MSCCNQNKKAPWYKTPFGILALVLFAGAAYSIWTEHRVHLYNLLPLLLILVCPLMHLFMHGNHGNDHSASKEEHRHAP